MMYVGKTQNTSYRRTQKFAQSEALDLGFSAVTLFLLLVSAVSVSVPFLVLGCVFRCCILPWVRVRVRVRPRVITLTVLNSEKRS
jgi:hypothetical protein